MEDKKDTQLRIEECTYIEAILESMDNIANKLEEEETKIKELRKINNTLITLSIVNFILIIILTLIILEVK